MKHDQTRNQKAEIFKKKVAEKEALKLQARRNFRKDIWFGFAITGMIGWSVVIPTLIGVMIGVWLDRVSPSHHSWTLTLLITGLLLGCLNAWRWIEKENKKIKKLQEKKGNQSGNESSND